MEKKKYAIDFYLLLILSWCIMMFGKIYLPEAFAKSIYHLPMTIYIYLCWPFIFVVLILEIKHARKSGPSNNEDKFKMSWFENNEDENRSMIPRNENNNDDC